MTLFIIGIVIALVLIFGGKSIAKKAGALAKKIIKIVVLGYAYFLFMGLIAYLFSDTSRFLTILFWLIPVAVWFIPQKADIRKQSEQADHQLHQFCFE